MTIEEKEKMLVKLIQGVMEIQNVLDFDDETMPILNKLDALNVIREYAEELVGLPELTFLNKIKNQDFYEAVNDFRQLKLKL